MVYATSQRNANFRFSTRSFAATSSRMAHMFHAQWTFSEWHKCKIIHNLKNISKCTCCIIIFLLFILTANGSLPSGSGTTIRHNTQITHITLKQNTAHKITPTTKDTLHIMNTKQIHLQLQQIQLQLQLYKLI
jgi:hypothetical protein